MASFSESGYQALWDKIENGLTRVINGVNHVIHIVEDATSWIPIFGDWLKSKLQDLVNKVEAFERVVQNYMKAFSVPSFMWSASNLWSTVEQNTGNLASGISGEAQTAASTWQGIAGGAYKQGVSNQGPAVMDMNGLAATLSNTAQNVAILGFAFFTACAVAIAALLIGLITIETVIGAIAAIATAVMAVSSGYLALRLGLSDQTRTLSGKLSGNSALPGGSWPLATSS